MSAVEAGVASSRPRKAPRFPATGPVYRVALVREGTRKPKGKGFSRAADVHAMMGDYMRSLGQEELWALFCDAKNAVVGSTMVSRGTLDASLGHPREVFRGAIVAGAASIMIVHNHPSGDPEPGQEDRELTERLVEAGRILGVPVLDHVVIGNGQFVSMAERGWV